MDTAELLLSLQELDLQIARASERAQNPPELAALEKAVRARKRVESLMGPIKGQRKDLEMALADLDEDRKRLESAIEEVKARSESGPMDYRSQESIREQYSNLAKRLEKVEFTSESTMVALVEIEGREAKANVALERAGQAVDAIAKRARATVGEARSEVFKLREERRRLAEGLDGDALLAYERAMERFDGLAVEELRGKSPSICRVSLQPGVIAELEREAPITECPYCKRILVIGRGG